MWWKLLSAEGSFCSGAMPWNCGTPFEGHRSIVYSSFLNVQQERGSFVGVETACYDFASTDLILASVKEGFWFLFQRSDNYENDVYSLFA